jgi:hypothetical protein
MTAAGSTGSELVIPGDHVSGNAQSGLPGWSLERSKAET